MYILGVLMCSKFVWYEANVYMPESPISDETHVTVAKRASFCMEFDFGHSARPMCWPSSGVSVSRTTLLSLRESERENAFAADDTRAVFKSPSKLRAPLHPVLSCSLPFSFCSLLIKITSSAVSFCT